MARVGKLIAGWKAVLVLAVGLGAAGVIATHAMAGGSELTVGRVTLALNEDTQMRVEVSDVGSPGLGAWEIDIDYDPDVVTPVSCAAGPGGICNTDFGPGTVRIVGADADGITGDVVIGTVRFRCDDPGATALALTAVEIADATEGAPQPINVDVQHGSINCIEPEPPDEEEEGDANCDGTVNSIDALIVLQYVAGLRNTVPCPDAADVDHNGRLTSVDAALILQIDAGLI